MNNFSPTWRGSRQSVSELFRFVKLEVNFVESCPQKQSQ